MTEQYVLQQLLVSGLEPIFYWGLERAVAEVDFIVQHSSQIIPIEVKAEENLKAKSLRSYYDKFKPDKVFRTSMSDYRKQDWLVNLPLYALANFRSLE